MAFTYADQYHPQRIKALRHRLSEAGVVFHFSVWQAPCGAAHRNAAQALFEQRIVPDFHRHQAAVAERYATWIANEKSPEQRHRLTEEAEVVTQRQLWLDLDAAEPRHLNTGDWLTQLRKSFLDPPYGLRIPEAERDQLWQEFCETTGMATPQAQVVDWIRHTWQDRLGIRAVDVPVSNWFVDGWDWWGVWLLTVFDPVNQTMSALAASTTD